jgi:hypothetical protein
LRFYLETSFSPQIPFDHFFIMSPHATQGTTAAAGEDSEGKTPRHWIMGREAFEQRMPHHDGIKALWETRWKLPVSNCLSPSPWTTSSSTQPDSVQKY